MARIRLTQAQANTAYEIISDYDAGADEQILDALFDRLLTTDRPTLSEKEAALVLDAMETRENWDAAMERLATKL